MTSELADLINRAGIRVSFCMCCEMFCLVTKRSLCCGEAVDDGHPDLAAFKEHAGIT